MGSEVLGDQRHRMRRAAELKEAIRRQAEVVAEGDEAYPPDHLLRLIGPAPAETKSAQAWRAAAAAVASYRARWGISDVGDPLERPPATPAQSAQLAGVRLSVDRLTSRELRKQEWEPMDSMSLGL